MMASTASHHWTALEPLGGGSLASYRVKPYDVHRGTYPFRGVDADLDELLDETSIAGCLIWYGGETYGGDLLMFTGQTADAEVRAIWDAYGFISSGALQRASRRTPDHPAGSFTIDHDGHRLVITLIDAEADLPDGVEPFEAVPLLAG